MELHTVYFITFPTNENYFKIQYLIWNCSELCCAGLLLLAAVLANWPCWLTKCVEIVGTMCWWLCLALWFPDQIPEPTFQLSWFMVWCIVIYYISVSLISTMFLICWCSFILVIFNIMLVLKYIKLNLKFF